MRIFWRALLCAICLVCAAAGPGHTVCGDVDADGHPAMVSDVIYLADYLWGGGPVPPVYNDADLDEHRGLTMMDMAMIIGHVFAAPCSPPPDCDPDFNYEFQAAGSLPSWPEIDTRDPGGWPVGELTNTVDFYLKMPEVAFDVGAVKVAVQFKRTDRGPVWAESVDWDKSGTEQLFLPEAGRWDFERGYITHQENPDLVSDDLIVQIVPGACLPCSAPVAGIPLSDYYLFSVDLTTVPGFEPTGPCGVSVNPRVFPPFGAPHDPSFTSNKSQLLDCGSKSQITLKEPDFPNSVDATPAPSLGLIGLTALGLGLASGGYVVLWRRRSVDN